MDPSISRPSTPRPSTPPPRTGLLTPPSTGRTRKRVLFVELQESHLTSKRQNKNRVHEGELPDQFFEDYNEGSDSQSDQESTTSSPSADSDRGSSEAGCSSDETATSASSPPTCTPIFDEDKDRVDAPSNFVSASPSAPFPFTKLPLYVRNKVYEHILVVPAIICVRQKHTAYHDEKKAFLYAERRELLPGIAYALAQTKVDGFKTRFSRFAGTNLNILRASKQVFAEARAVMFSKNQFEIVKPSSEQTPEPDYSVPLFPSRYQRLVTKLNIRIRTFYDLDWMLSGGYNVMKNYYRGLDTLTLILEIDSASKGFGRQWSRKTNERWADYIKRLRAKLAEDLFKNTQSKRAASIPAWIDLRVLFSGDAYMGNSLTPLDTTGVAVTDSMRIEQVKREELRSALVESWELFKKGGQ